MDAQNTLELYIYGRKPQYQFFMSETELSRLIDELDSSTLASRLIFMASSSSSPLPLIPKLAHNYRSTDYRHEEKPKPIRQHVKTRSRKRRGASLTY